MSVSRLAMLQEFGSLLPTVLWIFKLFGAFPMVKGEGMTYSFSWKLYLYTILVGLVSTVQGIYWMTTDIELGRFLGALLTGNIVTCFYIFSWLVILIMFYFQHESISSTMTELCKISSSIGNITYGRQYALGTIFITGLNVVPTVIYAIDDKDNLLNIVLGIIYFVFINLPVMVSGLYAVLLSILSDQMTFITNQLILSKFSLEVSHLVDIHNILCKIAALINKAFNLFLLQTIVFPFLIIVNTMYGTIVAAIQPDIFNDGTRLLSNIIDISVNIGLIALNITAATGAKNSAACFNLELLDIMLVNKTLGKDNNLKTYLAMENTIQQNAYGLFNLELPLLTSMAAGATTYVTIFVQFIKLEAKST